MIAILTVTVATFVGTALDNLLLLTLLRLAGVPGRQVAAGFLLGSLVILALCAAGTALAVVMPVHRVGLLGVIPLSIGAIGLLAAARRRDSAPEVAADGGAGGALGIATTQIASSFDTLAAFLPLFADTVRPQGLVIALGFSVMSVTWLALSGRLARMRGASALIRPFERVVRPAVLVLVGLYILADTPTDVELDAPEQTAQVVASRLPPRAQLI